jgi:hypothetical protein
MDGFVTAYCKHSDICLAGLREITRNFPESGLSISGYV